MRTAIFTAFLASMVTWTFAAMAQADRLSDQEAVAGLKAALAKGSQAAVASLGRTDGFLGGPGVRPPAARSCAKCSVR
ncbi:MAG TPA: DUF4197 family protein [Burkholderiales bacterium]